MSNMFEVILNDHLESLYSLGVAVIPRTLKVSHKQGKSTTVTGIRRSGKSTLLKQFIREGKQNQPPLHISFFDERLINLKAQELGEFIVAYGKLNNGQAPYQFFFDEIQLVENWELFVARLLENPKNQVYITGSSAKLLSKEIASSMRGRNLTFELFPFSWFEFLNFKKFDSTKLTSSKLGQRKKYFEEYLMWGGIS